MARATPPRGFDTIHRVLGAAMREVEPMLWPPRPHGGGSLPVVTTRGHLEIALAIGRVVRASLPRGEGAAFDAMIALAEAAAAGALCTRKGLEDASKPAKADAPALRAAKIIVRAASNFRFASPSARNSVGTRAEGAAIAHLEALHARGDAAIRDFLTWLDDEIVRTELVELLAERGLVPTAAVARVVARPANPKGTLGLAIAMLADGRYGLYAKLRARWEWHEGDRASVFATVPDAYMEAVIGDLDGGSSAFSAQASSS